MTVVLLNKTKFHVGDEVEMVFPGHEHIRFGLKIGVKTWVVNAGKTHVELAIPGSTGSSISLNYRVKLVSSKPAQGELFD